jgi:hypothetical protein
MGLEAWLIRSEKDLPAEPEYSHYQAPWISEDKIRHLDYIVVPEIFLSLPTRISNTFSGHFVIWWLSVDNTTHWTGRNYESKNNPLSDAWSGTNLSILELAKLLRRKLLVRLEALRSLFRADYEIDLSKALHICQSHYALDFVQTKLSTPSNQPFLVTDYVRILPVLKSPASSQDNPTHRPLIVYNPFKGGELVKKVLKHLSPEIQVLPLMNMTGGQLRAELSRASLYLDLGHFPGRDRLPREAASVKCHVMLAKRGAARYSGDFPIPESDKFELKITTPRAVAQRIQEFINDLQLSSKRQVEFQDFVSEDNERFHLEVKTWVHSLGKLPLQ